MTLDELWDLFPNFYNLLNKMCLADDPLMIRFFDAADGNPAFAVYAEIVASFLDFEYAVEIIEYLGLFWGLF